MLKSLILLLLSFSIYSQEVTIITVKTFTEAGYDATYGYIKTQFAVNAETNQAWIAESLLPSMFGDGQTGESKKNYISLSNLSYNSSTNSIIYNFRGKDIVCGYVMKANEHSYIGHSGKCLIYAVQLNSAQGNELAKFNISEPGIYLKITQ
jgi:hypothetical protein